MAYEQKEVQVDSLTGSVPEAQSKGLVFSLPLIPNGALVRSLNQYHNTDVP